MENFVPAPSMPPTDLPESLPPASDFTAFLVAFGIGVVLLSFVINVLLCGCRKRGKKPLLTDMHLLTNNATVIDVSPTHDVINVLLCGCRKRRKKPLLTDMHPLTNNATVIAVPPTHDGVSGATLISLLPASNSIRVWEVDVASMERFLHDMAREKPVRFTAQQICSFTHDYSTELGSGGFGVVYEGGFPNGMKIAVKILNGSGKRVEEQFMAEVATIGRTHHINLVRLHGFCFDHSMSALVYEYMENGSLDKFLFRNTSVIEFDKLHEIAIGTAKGLAYLHEDCRQKIIHYDIKPGNVLLDSNFSPKVADFGLAKLCNKDDSHDSNTGYRGTPGYSAPEFLLKNYPITYKCDVYSFGMLLFEIVGRRKNANSNAVDTLDWFPKEVWKEYKKGGLMEMTEKCGIEGEDKEKAERMFMVALWCVQDSPEARPLMSNVVKMLEGGVDIMPPPKPFQYLYSARTNASLPTSGNGGNSSYSASQNTGTETPLMRKYGIQMAR